MAAFNLVVFVFVMFLTDGTPKSGIVDLPEGTQCTGELAKAIIDAEANRNHFIINQEYWLWECKDVKSPGPVVVT